MNLYIVLEGVQPGRRRHHRDGRRPCGVPVGSCSLVALRLQFVGGWVNKNYVPPNLNKFYPLPESQAYWHRQRGGQFV